MGLAFKFAAVATPQFDPANPGAIGGTTPATGAFTLLAAQKLGLSGHNLTADEATPTLDLTTTWDTSGNPDLISGDLTDTASDSSSNLINLKVGGASNFRVRKDGSLFFGSTRMYNDDNLIRFEGTNGSGSQVYSAWGIWTILGGIQVGNGLGSPYWSGIYAREANNIHDFYWSTFGQTLRIFNTRTNADNFERVKMGWNDGAFEFMPEAAGTGVVRVLHISGLPNSNPGPGILWNDGGTVKVGT